MLLSLLLTAGCTVKAPPAPQSTETSQSPTPPPPKATQIIMGIDSIGAGFNPHLMSDQSPVNAAISALVLPSSFRPVPDSSTTTGAGVSPESPAVTVGWLESSTVGSGTDDSGGVLEGSMASRLGVLDLSGSSPPTEVTE